MSTSEQSGSRMVRRLRRCHACGAQTAVSVPHCWLCHTNLDDKPLRSGQFSIGALLLTMTLVAVVLTVFRFSIASGVVLLVIVVPATVRTMIVCLPDDLPTAALADGRDLSLLGITATATALFWTLPTVRLWQRSDLIDRRAGKRGPRWCAGGPISLLNLDGMRHAAGIAAAVRHHAWVGTVRGTTHATRAGRSSTLKCSIRLAPDLPATSLSHVASRLAASGVISPMPVMTTRRMRAPAGP